MHDVFPYDTRRRFENIRRAREAAAQAALAK